MIGWQFCRPIFLRATSGARRRFVAPYRVRDAKIEILIICHGVFRTSLMQRKYRINSTIYISLESLHFCTYGHGEREGLVSEVSSTLWRRG